MSERIPWGVRLADPMVVAVGALGITQITAWGTSFYCLGVLAGSISHDLSWSRGFVFLGFTVALLVMGVSSPVVGRAIDRRGARVIMTLGTALLSAGLFALAHVSTQLAYLAVWAFLGLGMRLCLYDAAFAALVQIAPSRGRIAISYLTLFGAFAFTLIMGASQGVLTIVRGALPLILFGVKRYGTVLGLIATPVLVVNAASPAVFAWIVDHWGWGVVRGSLLVSCVAARVAMELMARWYERERGNVDDGAGSVLLPERAPRASRSLDGRPRIAYEDRHD